MEQFFKTVYIIDEDPDNVEVITEVVTRISAQFKCFGFNENEEAITAIKERVPHYILLNVNLPKVRGDIFLRALRQLKELEDTFIVALSIDMTPDVQRMLQAHGANLAIEKPWLIDDYLNILKDVFKD